MIGSFSLQGSKRYNEDACVAYEDRNTFTLTVADGHGHSGEGSDCASHCVLKSQLFTNEILNSDYALWDESKWVELCTEHYTHVHNSYRNFCIEKDASRFIDEFGIVQKKKGSPVHSGSTYSRTFTFPVSNGFRTVISYVGDSEIWINGMSMYEDQSPLSESVQERLKVIPESDRMIAVYDKPNEIIQHLPRVFIDGKKDMKYVSNPGDYNLVPCNARYEPSSYFISPPHLDYMKLGMASSIGDFYCNRMGLSFKPIVHVINTDTIPFIVMASDGVWNTMDKNCIWKSGSFVINGIFDKKSQSSLEKTVYELRKLYSIKYGKDKIDDISMATLYPK